MKPDEAIRNEMILASAGSGKTYQLTNRYIGLMARGFDPESIIALTFTRKAAGEFFDSILEKLAEAATDPATCDKLAESPYISRLTCEDYRDLLRKVVDRMHLLFLGTLDSFFVSIVHNFPFEFGLSGDFEILDDHLADLEKERVYRNVFQRSAVTERDSHAFLEAFKLATFGKEESRVFNDLNRFVDKQHDIFLAAPDGAVWGNADAIWPGGCPWLSPGVKLDREFDQLFRIFEGEDLTDAQWARWRAFREAAENHAPGNPIAKALDYLLQNLLKVWGDLEMKSAAPTVERRKQTLTPEACDCACRIVKKIVGGEIDTRLRRTRGIWTVLRQYEASYGQLVRRRGKLTFNDLQLILAGQELEDSASAGRLLSQKPSAADRLNIDYRLDGRFDHWLLDEFQDTNHLQWHIIENLIDEVMQDASGARTYFQVGDVKQAIYGWRGGDTRLFYEVRDRYNVNRQKRIFPRELNDSWRSCPAVIEMVNDVFADKAALRELYPSDAIDRWEFGEHVSKHPDMEGFATLLNPPAMTEKGARLQLDDSLAIVVAILEEIQPVKNGLSCAVLLQTNTNIARTVDYIRSRSTSRIPVLSEAEISVANDSALNLALLSLLKFAAHPGDRFAWWHLVMTPFNDVFESRQLGRAALAAEVTRSVHRNGFESTLQHWIDQLPYSETGVPPVPPQPRSRSTGEPISFDPFTQRRAAELLLAAQQFDGTGSRNITEFLRFAESYTLRETATKGVVNVMTIHKSKGLGFDVVILPDLAGNALTTARDGIAVHQDPVSQDVEWILDLPPRFICEIDPVIARHLEDDAADQCYESLCKFYVALTRAKRGLYCITNPPPKTKSTSRNFVMLLEQTLRRDDATTPITIGDTPCDQVYATGERNWHATLKKTSANSALSSANSALKPRPSRVATTETRRRPQRRTPSSTESHEITAAQLFSRGGKYARDYGTAVHALFEQIEWLDGIEDPAALYPQWESAAHIPETLRDDVRTEVLACLEAPEIRDALSKPKPSVSSVVQTSPPELWRERRFEIVLGNDWLSGTFDRVVFEPAENRATILDFKTNRINPADDEALEKAVAGYRPQLETYRRVLARMTGLPESAITCQLLFTKAARIASV